MSSRGRLQTIDAVRGAVMIIMALDHTREFFHAAAASFSPEDLSRATAATFLTRWITHFCAPTFMLTTGLGAFFYGRNRGKGELARFLWTRGLWLMFLELTVMHFALYFNFDYRFVILTVLWGLGGCMVVLAAMIYLPARVLLGVSIGLIALHDLATRIPGVGLVLFSLGEHRILISYPAFAWVGVMAAGYCLGPVFLREPADRQRALFRLGLGLSGLFIILRGINHYGDPGPWSVQPSALFSVLSFLRCAKYPPSLDFLLMTLGPAIMAMAWLDRVRFSARNPLIVFGRVPLFYFLAHLFAIHAAGMLLAYLRYGGAGFFLNPPPSMGTPAAIFPTGYGYSLWAVYAIWLAIVASLYPLCVWFGNLKERRRDWWLSYL